MEGQGEQQMRKAMVALAAGGLLLTGGCSGQSAVRDARAQVDTFHARLESERYETIWNESAREIRDTTTRQRFIDMLTSVHGRLGRVRETRQTGWRVDTGTGGSFAALSMQTVFEHGAAQEDFVWRETGQGLKLAGYHIQPGGRQAARNGRPIVAGR
jgi:hypothetical protein